MKTIKVVLNNEIDKAVRKALTVEPGVFPDAEVEFFNVDSTNFMHHRKSNKIKNDYAVTKLPFVLLCDEDKEYAAVYSEEGDVTIKRIIEKL